MKKRVLSLLLTVMMIAGLIPFDEVTAATKGNLSIDVNVGAMMALNNITIKDVEGTVEKSDNANESIVKLTEVCDEIQITLTAVKNGGPANMPITLLNYSINGDKAVNFTAKNMNQGYADVELIPEWDEEGKYVAKIAIGGPSTGTHTLVFETPLTPKYFVEEIALNKEAADVFVGDDMQLSASVLPEKASQKVEWSTEDANIATVSKDGIVTGKKAGTTTITATTKETNENGKTLSASCEVTVKNVEVTGLELNKSETEIGIGSTETLKAIIAPDNATIKDVIWSSSESDVASVDKNGVVTGKKAGTATITATSEANEKLYAECKVKVKKIDVASVSLNPKAAEIEIGKKETLTATVLPENASFKDVVWTSSDSRIASVDEKGTVTGVEEGTVTITATSSDNKEIYEQCQVTVKRIYVTGIKLKESTEIEIGKKSTLTATITPENATDKDVVWMSSDTRVAVVDKEGRVTGVSLGEATIFAVAKGRDVNGNMLTASCDVTVVEEREVLVPTVIYENGVEGKGWPYNDAYINTITINGANVKSYSWSGNTCNVLLSNKTMQDAEFEMSITKAGTNMWVQNMAVKLNGSSISDKGTIQLKNGKADNVPLYVNATFSSGTKYFNFSIAEPNNLPTLIDRTNIEAEATVVGKAGYSLNVGKLFTDVDEGDVLSYNVSVDGGESVPITLDENGLYTHTTDLPGTYTLVFTATDSKGDTSKDKYTVTLNVVNSSETYDAIVNIPEGIEPDFYINDGFDTDGNPVNGEELKSAKEGIIDGLVKYSVKVPDNIEMINIDDGKRNIAAEVSRDTSVSFREAIVKVTDKFDTTVDGSVSVTYGDFTATPDEDGKYLLATENEYTLTATPKDTKSFKVETVTATVENGTGVAEISAKVEFNNLKTVTAPTGADVRFYSYNKYYDNTEYVCRGSEKIDDKNSLYYFSGATLPAGGGTFIYRVKYKDYAVKAGWTTSNVTITFDESDLKSNAYIDYGSSADGNKDIADDSVLLNVNGQNNLALSVGGTKTLKAYRAWEIIPVSYNNNIITPDFHYNIISGEDVVKLTDKSSLSTTDTDWKTLTALKEGVAIIEVAYDAVTVSGSQSWNGTYGATDPARTGLMVVQVGGHDPSVEFGIDCFASQGSTTYSASNAREWDAEFDTLYFTGDYGELKLSPNASGKITDVAVSNDKGSSWKSLTSENGAYTAKIVHGNNIIRVTTEAGTAYQVVRGGKVTYSVIETDGDGDGLIEAGESARIILKGLHSPIPKMAGNYNPGFKANSDGDSSVHIKYTFNDKTVKGQGVQYTFGAEGNCIDVTIPADYTEKTIDLTAGYIGLGVIGLTNFADGGDSHRNIPDGGCTTRGSQTTFHTRSILPNITLTIGESASANTPPEVAAGAIKTASVKLGQIFAINPETLFTDDDGNKLTYSVSVDGNESKAIDSAYRFEPKAEGEYVLTFTASDGEAEVSHSVTLSVEKADVSDDKDPVFDTSGKIEGYVTVSFEDNGIRDKDAVGLKYPVPLGTIIPKTKVPYVKGDTVADVTLRMLDAMNVGYEYSGTTKSGFYLGTIKDFVVDRVPYDKMGEFDAGEGSGWMITHNDEFIQAGASEFTVKDGDIVAWKYTCQLGADIGDSFYAKDVDSVIDMIDAIGEVTLNSAGKIASARAAYEMLDDIQKNKVSNYDDLLSAEKALAELVAGLQRPSYEEAYKVTGNYLSSAADRVTPTVNSTGGDWIIVGLERSGHETSNDYYNNVVEYVKENINEKGQLHSARSTDNSRVVLALTAAGIDPTDVEGYNLLEGLTDLAYIKRQGINGPIWALIAFDSHDYEIPEGDVTKDALIKEILDEQLEDGGWDLKGTAADADMTGMALQALAPYYNSDKTVKDAVDKALRKLSEIQNADGTFGSIDGPSAESCAQVIVALTALGIDPAEDSRFVKNGLSVVDGLLVFAMEDGGFRHIVNGQLDGMATEQGYYALAAYDRFLKEKSSLYDMSDVELSKGKYTREDTTDKTTSEDKKATDKSKTKSINLKLTEKVTKEQLAQGKENHYCEDTGVDARDNSNDILPWYIKLNVVKQEITDDQKAQVSEALGGEGEVFILKDIHFTNTKDGSEWQPTKPVKIKIPMVDIGDYENAVIVHITDDGKIELIKGTVKDGMIEFEADSFSLYGIAGTNTSINDLLGVEDDGAVVWPWIVIAIIALVAIAYLVYRRKREA